MDFKVEKKLVDKGNATLITVSYKGYAVSKKVRMNLLCLHSEHLGHLIVSQLKEEIVNKEKREREARERR